MAARRALITGIGGQDGSLLAELLLDQDYEVFGVVRRSSAQYANLEPLRDRVDLITADLLDQVSLLNALGACRPHEVYNL
ncbi:MAG TPA: GDP-mannose 4,6-dehydratase, partial [Chloroflexi bacterium]|nr:GDP-mannose 4,6-dehydratase [Chloroflexota bacterium]